MSSDNGDFRSTGRAIKDVTASFTRALKQALSDAGTQASQELIEDLRQATSELNDAITTAGLKIAGQGVPKAERTRAKLLEAARRVIAEKGYEGASVGDIASAAGYTKGAVYANFGSKEQLFIVLARQLLAEDSAEMAAAQAALPDPRALLTSEDLTEKTLFVLEMYLYAIRHSEVRADLAPLLTAVQDDFAALIHRHRATADPAAPDDGPTQADRDLAFAHSALNTVGSIMALLPELGSPEDRAASIRRLTDRLSGTSDLV